MSPRLLLLALARRPALAAALAGLLLTALDAEARVGGGQRYGGGGRSSGGGWSGGGGSGDGGDALYLMFWLLWHHPALGVPVLVVVALVVLGDMRRKRSWDSYRTVEGMPHGATSVRTRPRASRAGLGALAARDPGLSEPVLHDYVQLVIRRALAARTLEDQAALAPFIAPTGWRGVLAARGPEPVDDVIIAGTTLVGTREVDGRDLLTVEVRSARTDPAGRDLLCDERWTFARARGAHSLPPERTRRLGCPSCGAAVALDDAGRCTACSSPTTAQLQWQLVEVVSLGCEPNLPPETGWTSGGEEPSWHVATWVDPSLPAASRAFHGRHPGFDPDAWERRIRDTFLALQAAWSRTAWDEARPHCTDAAWNTLRFWMRGYARAGLRNRVEDVVILRLQVVRLTVDAWYEAVTVRIWASARDWTEDADGRVVGGNAKTARRFSEYWTFLRAVGSGEAVHDVHRCPSCGAPLDRISAAGVCGYCDSVIVTGQHDWVLSRIQQPDAYRGG